MENNIALLVVSCDKYSDIWEPFFKTFHKYWSDCPYQLYLASNYKQYDDSKVKIISYGEDKPFSTNLINILKHVKEEYILLWFEDALFTKKVNTKIISNLINKAISLEISHLKLTVDYPLYYGKENVPFGKIPKGVKYRSAIGMALYKKEMLNKILIPGMSAWELDKSSKSDDLDLEFYSLNSKLRFDPPFHFINLVIKGKWIYSGPKFLKKNGFEDNINKREKQSIKDYIYIILYHLRIEFFFLFKKYWYN